MTKVLLVPPLAYEDKGYCKLLDRMAETGYDVIIRSDFVEIIRLLIEEDINQLIVYSSSKDIPKDEFLLFIVGVCCALKIPIKIIGLFSTDAPAALIHVKKFCKVDYYPSSHNFIRSNFFFVDP